MFCDSIFCWRNAAAILIFKRSWRSVRGSLAQFLQATSSWIWPLFAGLMVVSGSALGQSGADVPERAMSLLDTYQVARDSDPRLAIARYRVDGALANRDVAKSKYFPQISLFGDWSQNKVNYQSTALRSWTPVLLW